MRLLIFLVSAAVCSAFTVTDLLNLENASERQFDMQDQIMPAFLMTFILALINNILALNQQEQARDVSGILSYPCCCFISNYPMFMSSSHSSKKIDLGGHIMPGCRQASSHQRGFKISKRYSRSLNFLVFFSCFDNGRQTQGVWNFCWNLHSIKKKILRPP